MTIQTIIIFVLIGVVAGWLAGRIWQGAGFGFLGNLIVGVVGSFVGGFILKHFGIRFYGIVGSVIAAVVGALVLLFLASLIKTKK